MWNVFIVWWGWRLVGGILSATVGMYLSPEAEQPASRSAFVHQLTFYHFYPVAERNGKPLSKSRLTGFGSEQPEFAARNTATLKICTNKKKGVKIPLLKVLESLENFFQEVFKWGSGQSPETFPLTPESAP